MSNSVVEEGGLNPIAVWSREEKTQVGTMRNIGEKTGQARNFCGTRCQGGEGLLVAGKIPWTDSFQQRGSAGVKGVRRKINLDT